MNTRRASGQLSITALIGIVVVVIIILLYYIVNRSNETITEVKTTLAFEQVVQTARSYVHDCTQETLKDAVKKVASQGGYYLLPEEKKAETPYGTTVYAYSKKNVLISKGNMKQEILRYMQNNIKRVCKLEEFRDATLAPHEFSGTLLFSANKLTLQMKWPIDVSRGDAKSAIKDMTVEFETRLDQMHTHLNNLMEELDNDIHMASYKFPEGMDIHVLQENDEAIYVLTDSLSVIDKKPLRFFFKVKR